jgi:Ribonuclease G/E
VVELTEQLTEQLVINVDPEQTRAALVADGVLQDLQIDRVQHRSLTGNVYRGKVVRVIGGIQAAFVDIGMQRHGFLHAADVTAKPLMLADTDTNERRVDIRKLLHEGQEVIVQVVKDAIDDKGAKVNNVVISGYKCSGTDPEARPTGYFSAHRKSDRAAAIKEYFVSATGRYRFWPDCAHRH